MDNLLGGIRMVKIMVEREYILPVDKDNSGDSDSVAIIFELQDIKKPYHIPKNGYGGWGMGDREFPIMVEVDLDTYTRMKKASSEFRWFQKQLDKLTKGIYPEKCQCGNCPARKRKK